MLNYFESLIPSRECSNQKDFNFFYGADGFLYAQNKINGDLYVLFDGVWIQHDEILTLDQNYLEAMQHEDDDFYS